MSKKVIVSIISKNNIPNMSLIINLEADIYLDILTEESKNKFYKHYFNAITDENTLPIKDKFEKITVDESDPENINKELLSKASLFNDAEIIYVNITGGTKPLSLYTYLFFKNNYPKKSKFYYMNISSSSNMFIDVDKNKNENQKQMKTVLTLKQYLRSYNYTFKDEPTNIDKDEFEKASIILKEYTDDNTDSEKKYLNVRSMLNTLQTKINKKKSIEKLCENGFDIKNIINKLQEQYGNDDKDINTLAKNRDKICDFIDNISNRLNNYNFPNSQNMNKKTLKFIISEFLEIYIYYLIKSEIFDNSNQQNMVKDNLKHSLELESVVKNDKNKNNEAELDVLFNYNNLLCYIECKSSADNKIIKESLFKQAAISDNLGISAKNILVVLYKETNDEKKRQEETENLKEKAKRLHINIVMKEDLLNGSFIADLKKYCKISM